MPIYEFEGKRPKISPGAFVHPTAVIIGDVTISDRCWIGPHTTMRADVGHIEVGYGTAVQDNCIIHGITTILGSYSSLGHGAIVHGARVGDHTLIAMGAIVLDEAEVGSYCVVAAGAVVSPHAKIPDGKVVMGVPGAIVGDETSRGQRRETESEDPDVGYRGLTVRYHKSLRELSLQEVLQA